MRRRPWRDALALGLWLACLLAPAIVPAQAAWRAGPRHSVVITPHHSREFLDEFMHPFAPSPAPHASVPAASPPAHATMAPLVPKPHQQVDIAAALKPTANPAYAVRVGDNLKLSGWNTWSRTLKGIEVNLNPGGALAGQRISLFGGAGVDAGDDYTTGLSWVSQSGGGRTLGVDLLYNARSANGDLDSQWVARVGGGLSLPSPLAGPALRLEGGVATMRVSGISDGSGSAAGGAFLRLTRPRSAATGFSYGLIARRYGLGFTPIGGNQVAGQEALEARMNYRFSSGMQFRVSSLVAVSGFDTSDPLWMHQASVGLFGALLPWLFDDMSASLETFLRDRRDHAGNEGFRTAGVDLKLRQALGLGWSSRMGVALAWDCNRVENESALRRQFSLAGRHRLHFGSYTGSIGPGVAWRRGGGFESSREFEAGMALELADYMHSLRLDMAYLSRQDGFDSAPQQQSFQTMLLYRLWLGANQHPTRSSGWYDLKLVDGF